jgi:hypothetical protein
LSLLSLRATRSEARQALVIHLGRIAPRAFAILSDQDSQALRDAMRSVAELEVNEEVRNSLRSISEQGAAPRSPRD